MLVLLPLRAWDGLAASFAFFASTAATAPWHEAGRSVVRGIEGPGAVVLFAAFLAAMSFLGPFHERDRALFGCGLLALALAACLASAFSAEGVPAWGFYFALGGSAVGQLAAALPRALARTPRPTPIPVR